MTTTAFSDVIYKFSTPTTAGTVPTISTTTLFANTHDNIDFNLQIVEKGNHSASSNNFSSTSVGPASNQFDDDVSRELANIITAVLNDKALMTINLTNVVPGVVGSGRNIRSMKLVINIDPYA